MTEKKKKCDKKFSIEELYQNKNFVPPKEKNLETIFEEPRKAKDGAPILTSVRKYKRYLHFDPTEGKIHKRKLKAKKCNSNLKNGKRTRSSTKKPKCKDISMYIMEAIGESSDSEMEATYDKGTNANDKGTDANNKSNDANAKGANPTDNGTDVNDKGTGANNKDTDANDKGSDAYRNYTSNLSENDGIALKRSQDKVDNVLKEDIEMKNTTQDPDTSEEDKSESKDVKMAKSPTRSSCIVT